jgi:lysozyme
LRRDFALATFSFGEEGEMTESGFVCGIDVSHFQGLIDWRKAAELDVKFAFIKATDGIAGIDAMFDTNWLASKAAGVRRGAYHFFRAEQDAERQAQSFISKLNEDWGELPGVLDFEVLGSASADQALNGVMCWMELVEAASGRMPLLYTGPSFWKTQVKDSNAFSTHALWIAHYTSALRPALPSAWKQWTFWQYSEQGNVPGIKGPVDLDRFSGNVMELEALGARINTMKATAGR